MTEPFYINEVDEAHHPDCLCWECYDEEEDIDLFGEQCNCGDGYCVTQDYA
jgi:hypothetical protein